MADGLKFTIDLDQKMSGLEKAIGSVDEATAKVEKMTAVVDKLEAAQRGIKPPKGLPETKKAARDAGEAVDQMSKDIAAARDELKKIKSPHELLKIKQQINDIKHPLKEIKASRLDNFMGDMGKGAFGGIASMASGMFIGQAIAGAFSGIASAITGAISGLKDLGKEALTAAGHQERLALSFNQLLGADVASKLLGDLDSLQTKTALTGTQLAEFARTFLAAGATAEEVKPLLAGALDMGSLMGGSEQAIQQSTRALSEMLITGRATDGVFKAMRITEKEAFADLERRTGKSTKLIKEQMAAGKIGGTDLVASVLSAVAGKSGGLLGTFADQAGQTLDARIAHLKDIPGRLFEGLAGGSGFTKLSEFVDKLQQFFDPSSGMGSRMQEALNRVFDVLATKLQNIDLEKFSEGLITFLDKLPGRVEKIVNVLEKLLKVAGFVFSGDSLAESVTESTGSKGLGVAAKVARSSAIDIAGAMINPMGFMRDKGTEIWKGLVGGTKSGEGQAADAGANLADKVKGGAMDILQIRSPSKVFETIGQQTAEGFTVGMRGMETDVQESLSPMVDIKSPSSMGGRGGARGALGATFTVNVPITVNGAGSPTETAEEIRRVLPMELASVFDRLRSEFAV